MGTHLGRYAQPPSQHRTDVDAGEVTYTLDASGQVVAWSQGAGRVLGHPADQVIGRHVSRLYPTEEIRLGIPEWELGEAERTGASTRQAWRTHPDGARVRIRSVTTAVRDASGHLAGFVRLERELNQQVGLEQFLRSRNRMYESERSARIRAEAATRARELVLSVVMHELGNLLSGILLNARALLNTSLPNGMADGPHTRANNILQLAQRMKRLRRDLLDIAAVDRGSLYVERRPVDPAALIQRTFDQFTELVSEGSLRLQCAVAGDLPTVLADGDRVLQVLSNLVDNAIKFTPAGGEIVLEAGPAADGVRFSVSNTGPGIAPEDVPHVFEQFWQRSPTNGGGVGLGLSIARELLVAHGTTIQLDNRPGNGTTFSFRLPAGAAQPPEAPQVP